MLLFYDVYWVKPGLGSPWIFNMCWKLLHLYFNFQLLSCINHNECIDWITLKQARMSPDETLMVRLCRNAIKICIFLFLYGQKGPYMSLKMILNCMPGNTMLRDLIIWESARASSQIHQLYIWYGSGAHSNCMEYVKLLELSFKTGRSFEYKSRTIFDPRRDFVVRRMFSNFIIRRVKLWKRAKYNCSISGSCFYLIMMGGYLTLIMSLTTHSRAATLYFLCSLRAAGRISLKIPEMKNVRPYLAVLLFALDTWTFTTHALFSSFSTLSITFLLPFPSSLSFSHPFCIGCSDHISAWTSSLVSFM